jgi:phosphoglycolate phosphatase
MPAPPAVPKRFDLVVFDWDGTLIDSTGAIVACIQAAARDVGIAVPDASKASHVIGMGLQDALAHAVPDLRDDQLPGFVARYRHHFLARDASLPLFPGTRPLLAELRRRGHLLAIATGKSRQGLARALDTSQLRDSFVATRCADQTEPKPHPAMLLELMEELDVPPERTLMIGDTTHDLAMAARAEVTAVGVTFGAHPRQQLEALAPVALVDSTAELDAWLREHA